MTDMPGAARYSVIQAVQMLGADEHRSERIVDARASSAGGNNADGPPGRRRSADLGKAVIQ